MKTAEEKYMADPAFHALVDSMVSAIGNEGFTPSEMREASLFACIRYEMMNVRRYVFTHGEMQTALIHLDAVRDALKMEGKNATAKRN